MTGEEATALDVIANTALGIAAPVKSSFLSALNHLLGGLTAVPAAKLRQYAQGIEDTTLARSAAAAAYAKAAVESGMIDPDLMQAATDIYMPAALRKARNRLLVAEKTAEHLSEADSTSSGAAAAPPSEDWMNTFARFAEDASSDKLQDLYSRILSGEICEPGKFSLSTLRVMSELDKDTADAFSRVHQTSVDGYILDQATYKAGISATTVTDLVSAGFLSSATLTMRGNVSDTEDGDWRIWAYAVGAAPTLGLWYKRRLNKTLELPFDPMVDVRLYTKMGVQIASLLPKHDYEPTLRSIAANPSYQNELIKAELRKDSDHETLFERDDDDL